MSEAQENVVIHIPLQAPAAPTKAETAAPTETQDTKKPQKDAPVQTSSEPRQFYSYKEIDESITNNYVFPTSNGSLICDLIAMYLKGQKILYTESKTVCEQRLNYLMLPAILVTSLCTIISLVMKDDPYGATITSSLNGANAFLLALISYLKLDAKAEAHRTAAYKFDKLQSYVEFTSGRMLFDTKAVKELVPIIQKIENDVREIKETNQFVLPEKIRFTYPKLYSTNVFSEVKKIQNKEMLVINAIKDVMNADLELKNGAKGRIFTDAERVKHDTHELDKQANIKKYIQLQDDYLKIDKAFEDELEAYRTSIARRCEICGWLKT
jgi:hypothetical protein